VLLEEQPLEQDTASAAATRSSR